MEEKYGHKIGTLLGGTCKICQEPVQLQEYDLPDVDS